MLMFDGQPSAPASLLPAEASVSPTVSPTVSQLIAALLTPGVTRRVAT